MSTVTRWKFTNNQNSDAFYTDGSLKGREGVMWIGKEPCTLHEGILYYGKPAVIAEHSDAPCSIKCRQATQPFCRCSCHGRNHGIENRDMANAIMEEDVIYLGWGD